MLRDRELCQLIQTRLDALLLALPSSAVVGKLDVDYALTSVNIDSTNGIIIEADGRVSSF